MAKEDSKEMPQGQGRVQGKTTRQRTRKSQREDPKSKANEESKGMHQGKGSLQGNVQRPRKSPWTNSSIHSLIKNAYKTPKKCLRHLKNAFPWILHWIRPWGLPLDSSFAFEHFLGVFLGLGLEFFLWTLPWS